MKKWQTLIPTSNDLEQLFTDTFGSQEHIASLLLKETNFWKRFYNLITVNTYDKYLANGQDDLTMFLEQLNENTYSFYLSVMTKQDLKLLEDYKNRGSIVLSAGSTWTQPTENGIEWDDETDAPVSKTKTQDRNILSNIKALATTRLRINLNYLWTDCEKYWIRADLIGDYYG